MTGLALVAAPAADDRAAGLLRAVQAAVARRQPLVARPLLRAAAALGADPLEQADAACRVLLLERRTAEALAALDAALAPFAEAGGEAAVMALRLLRAETRLHAGDAAGAAADAATVVLARQGGAAAKAVLGVALAECGRPAQALACLHEAAADREATNAMRVALAWAQQAQGDAAAAIATLDAAVAATPEDVLPRNAALRLALAQGDPARAVALGRAAQAVGVVDAMLLGLLGHALSKLQQPEEARGAYAAALLLAPDDGYVRHLAASFGDAAAPPEAAPDYIRVVFDGYADRFETHLIALGYRVPGLLRQLLPQHIDMSGAGGGPVLDLGCGTGLVAVALCDLPLGPWHGVDLSPAMLAHAASKRLYARLFEADLQTWLLQPGPRYRLVLAADVLCYFGALGRLFTEVAGRLLHGGLFAVSAEQLEDAAAGPGWLLGAAGRYRHSGAYLLDCARAAGLGVRLLRPEILRRDEGAPVPGWLMLLERTA